MRQSPPGMVLNLPAHTQRQLANMSASPAPVVADDASPRDQYRLTLAQRYRQQIQTIMNADLLAQDPDAITPAPITTTTDQITEILTEDFDEDDELPPYEEEGDTSDCTITVQEIDSPDTPSDNNMLQEPAFFADYMPDQFNGRPNSASSEPASIVTVECGEEPVPVPLMGRASALTLTKKGQVSVVEKPCREHYHFLRPRSRSNSAGKETRPKINSRNSKVRKQLASIFGGFREHYTAKPTTALVRSTGAVL